jgi:hypothetical protein
MNAVSKALISGVNITPSDKAAWDYIAESIGSRFSVSRQVIHARLDKEQLRSRAWLKRNGYL